MEQGVKMLGSPNRLAEGLTERIERELDLTDEQAEEVRTVLRGLREMTLTFLCP